MKFGLIAGNGKFPFMVVEGARQSGVPLVVAAIREETDPEMDQRADRVKWVGIGQLGRMIRFFKEEGVEKAIKNYWTCVERLVKEKVDHIIFSGAPISAMLTRPCLSGAQ